MSDDKIDYTPRPARGRKARAAVVPPEPRKPDAEEAVDAATQATRREEQAPPAPRKRSAEQTVDYTPRPARHEQRAQAARPSVSPPRLARAARGRRGPARSAPRFNVRSLLRNRTLMVVAGLIALVVLVIVPVVAELTGAGSGAAGGSPVALGNASFDAGSRLWDQGDYQGALDSYRQAATYYEQALLQTPEDAQVRTDLGTAYFYQGILLSDTVFLQRAVQTWNVALQYSPDKVETLFNLGLGYARTGQVDRAIGMWQRVIVLAPGSALAENAEELIQEYSAPAPTPY